jgi:hypothetical protein
MSARDTIKAQFQQVAVEQHRKLARFSDDLKLLESGLGSLSFSVIVAVMRWPWPSNCGSPAGLGLHVITTLASCSRADSAIGPWQASRYAVATGAHGDNSKSNRRSRNGAARRGASGAECRNPGVWRGLQCESSVSLRQPCAAS